MDRSWYKKDIEEIYSEFNSGFGGLSSEAVITNRAAYGENILEQTKKITFLTIFLSQFKSAFIYVLLIACLIVFLLGEYLDASIILFIILLNSIIGSIQEGKAQNTLATLKSYVEGKATVLRGGKYVVIPDHEVVPGDILILKDGETVTADARVIEANNVEVNESALTGETEVVSKSSNSIQGAVENVGDIHNMVFKGTQVMSGIGRAIVVSTGHDTEIGKIASKLDELHKDIPLKKNIENLSYLLIVVVVGVSILIFFSGLLHGITFKEMFITVVAIAVSAIPESLPVVVTLVLATGFWRMSKKNALVKRLQAVEALGQAKVLALDKTGTITKNQMTVEMLYIDGTEYMVSGSGYGPEGELRHQGHSVLPSTDEGISLAAKISSFTAIAEVAYDEDTKVWKLLLGDPTEAALKVFGSKMGMAKEKLLEQYPQTYEIPFDLHTKHHASINEVDGKSFFSTAGSPEVLLSASRYIWKDGQQKEISSKDLSEVKRDIRRVSGDGYRILALACDFEPPKPQEIDPENLKGLTFIGFVAIRDAIRPEVHQSLGLVKKAGLKPVMITGDYLDTAKAVASSVGIYKEGDQVITGSEVDDLSIEELSKKLGNVTVFARVSPEHKMKIIEGYKARGEIIAMTGDGINDSLSLVAADLGVAMGGIGTEVAKEAADIILLDDNFGTIATAVEEGRSIYSTIRKSILYLLSTNLGEILVIGIAVVLGLPLPLLATQIIWLNMVTDSFLVASLALEPKERGLLQANFRKPTKYLIDKLMGWRIGIIGGVMTLGTLALFILYLPDGYVKATTVALTVLTVFQWFNVFNVRSHTESVFSKGFFANKYLILSLGIVILLQLFAVYTPFMQQVLHTTALSLFDWIIILLVGVVIVIVEEVRKMIYRK